MSSTTTHVSRFATSADGTRIAYEVTGSGPALVLVDGAMCQRAMGPSRPLAKELADAFTVYAYDRRGRGDSGPGATPYTPQREVEDLLAVLGESGPDAHVLGSSSGAVLALEAARRGAQIGRLVTYEAPFIVDDSHAPNDPELPERVQAMVDDGRRAEAVRTFMRTVGVPAPFIVLMRLMPAWKHLTGVAHTLPYDLAMVSPFQQGEPLPAGYYDDVTCETLVLVGGKSPEYMRNGQDALVAALPHARLESLPRQTHMVKAPVVAPVVTEFLRG